MTLGVLWCASLNSGTSIGAERVTVSDLESYSKAYRSFHDKFKRAPDSWDELAEAGLAKGLKAKFEGSQYVAVFGVGYAGMRTGIDRFLLAYPKDVEKRGGLVATAAGKAATMTPEDYQTYLRLEFDSPKLDFPRAGLDAAVRAFKSPTHQLIAVKDDEKIAAGDKLWAVGPAGKMAEFVVREVLSDGKIRVSAKNFQAGFRLDYARWQVRRLTPVKGETQLLKALAADYMKFFHALKRGPDSWEELEDAGLATGLREKLTKLDYEVLFDIAYSTSPGDDLFVLAYPKNARQDGGLVVMASDRVLQLSAQDFQKTFDAQMYEVESARRLKIGQTDKKQTLEQAIRTFPKISKQLVEIGADEVLKPGDVVHVPYDGEMRESKVLAIRSDGSVKVLNDKFLHKIPLVFERWELRRAVAKSSQKKGAGASKASR